MLSYRLTENFAHWVWWVLPKKWQALENHCSINIWVKPGLFHSWNYLNHLLEWKDWLGQLCAWHILTNDSSSISVSFLLPKLNKLLRIQLSQHNTPIPKHITLSIFFFQWWHMFSKEISITFFFFFFFFFF